MSDKPNATKGECFAVPGWSVISLSGADASAFAQAQFMGDVAALAAGHWQWNGWLTPKGRVIALFALLRRDADSLLVLLADTAPETFVAALSRFVFRSKVRIAHETRLHVGGRFAQASTAHGARFSDHGTDEPALELDLGTGSGARTMTVDAVQAAEDGAAAERWERFDLAHGLPRLPPAQAEQWTPQQLSLDRLRAYSIKKGCYPGQEIVARTHFLGQAKRGLVRLAADAPIANAGVSAFEDRGRMLGSVISTAGHEALAVLPLDAGDGPFLVEAVRCQRWPLLDGLAR